MTKTGPALTPRLSGTGFGQDNSLPLPTSLTLNVVTNHAGLPRTFPVSESQSLIPSKPRWSVHYGAEPRVTQPSSAS